MKKGQLLIAAALAATVSQLFVAQFAYAREGLSGILQGADSMSGGLGAITALIVSLALVGLGLLYVTRSNKFS